MRRALIADIHGNSVALEAVLRDCEMRRVDEILCLGDIIGFLPDPIPCIDLIRKCCAWSLLGDHELSLFMREETYAAISSKAANALATQRKKLKPSWYSGADRKSRWSWLESLEPRKVFANALFVHGSPRDPIMEYALPSDFTAPTTPQTQELFSSFDGLCFCAHTHIPGVAQQNSEWLRPIEGSMRLREGEKTLVNVGSVGQPRDGDSRSCYAIWDDADRAVQFHRVEYDISKLKERLAALSPAGDFYYQRLEKGQ